MGKKRLTTEGIRVGDIFEINSFTWSLHGHYCEATAFQGKTLVVLREIQTETYVNRNIPEGSPLYWRRERIRPLPGQFLGPSDPETEHTAWIECWYQNGRERCRLRGLGKDKDLFFDLEYPEDWAEWTPEEVKAMEEYERACAERLRWSWKGEKNLPWQECPS